MMIDYNTLLVMLSATALFLVGCWVWAVTGDSIEELELRAARSIASQPGDWIVTVTPELRSGYFQQEYKLFTTTHLCTYEDYLLMVITKGSLNLH